MATDGLFLKPFSWINTRGVIIVGQLVTFVIASVLALLYNLDALSHMISAGTLLAYGTVCVGVILLRYAPVDELEEGASISPRSRSYFARFNSYAEFVYRFLALYLFIFVISSVVMGIAIKMSWPISILGVFGGIDFLIYLSLQLLRPTNIPTTFKCPLVPLIPLCAILVNILLFTALPFEALERILVWSTIGAIIYLFYGVQHSKLNEEKIIN